MKNCIGGKNYSVSIAKALQCYRNRIFFALLNDSHVGRASYRTCRSERRVTEKEY